MYRELLTLGAAAAGAVPGMLTALPAATAAQPDAASPARPRRAAAGKGPWPAGRAAHRPPARRDNGRVSEFSWVSLSTPVGPVWIGRSQAGVASVHIGSRPAARSGTAVAGAAPAGATAGQGEPGPVLEAARSQLAEYFSGRRRAFDVPLDLSALTEPQQQVLGVLAGSVGYGQTVSYGALAQRAGLRPGNDIPARAVGKIMGSNPIPLIIPCHRVVASDGLGGYSGGTGPEVKRWLLILEGALPPTLDWSPDGA